MHPLGQFDSWRRLGWDPRPERLLENARLVADHLGPFAELIRGEYLDSLRPDFAQPSLRRYAADDRLGTWVEVLHPGRQP